MERRGSATRRQEGNALSRDTGSIYRGELARIHHEGFGEFAASAAHRVIQLLARAGMSNGTVVDVGCGSGILAQHLSRKGYAVIGIDPSHAMLSLARETAPQAHFVAGRVGEIDLPRARAITAIGEVVNHASRSAVARFIRSSADALDRGGILLFDAAEPAPPSRQRYRVDGDGWIAMIEEHRDENRLTRRVLTFREIEGGVTRDEELHEIVLHRRADLLSLLRSAGLRVNVRRSYDGQRLPPHYSVYVCRR